MMVKVLLYGYCVGVASSRRIAQRLHEDIAFRVLAANNTPDFRTISDFRKDHLAALTGLFLQVLELCQRAGLVKLGHVALDGAKVRANASRHKAMSYRRMKEQAAQLAAEVAELLRRAQEVDEEEDRRYGQDRRGDELPEEPAFREGRLQKIRERWRRWKPRPRRRRNRSKQKVKSIPECPTTRPNATSPMPSPASCLGRAVGTPSRRTTVRRWSWLRRPLATPAQCPGKCPPTPVTTRQRRLTTCKGWALTPTSRRSRLATAGCRHPAPRGRIPRQLSPRDRMRRKLQTRRGRQRYALRMETVEPVFGQIKQGRGFRQFLLRGLEKVQGEWSLICTGHNLLKLFRCGRLAPG